MEGVLFFSFFIFHFSLIIRCIYIPYPPSLSLQTKQNHRFEAVSVLVHLVTYHGIPPPKKVCVFISLVRGFFIFLYSICMDMEV